MNFSEASNGCSQLNLQLASEKQVEEALKHGFETCRYVPSVSVAHFFSEHFHTQLRLVINLMLKALMLFIVVLDG